MSPRGAKPRTLLVNVTLAFVLAAVINSLLHEGAHAAAGLLQGRSVTLTPFSVETIPEGTAGQQVVTALAGPGFSLVLGAALMLLAHSWGRGFGRLFWLWLAFMGVMNFAGYRPGRWARP